MSALLGKLLKIRKEKEMKAHNAALKAAYLRRKKEEERDKAKEELLDFEKQRAAEEERLFEEAMAEPIQKRQLGKMKMQFAQLKNRSLDMEEDLAVLDEELEEAQEEEIAAHKVHKLTFKQKEKTARAHEDHEFVEAQKELRKQESQAAENFLARYSAKAKDSK